MDHEWILGQETPNTGRKSLSTGIVIISIFAACCAIGLSIFTLAHSKKANDTAEKLQQSLSKLQEDYEEQEPAANKALQSISCRTISCMQISSTTWRSLLHPSI